MTSFSLPSTITLHISSQALFIQPNYPTPTEHLIRLEWSTQPALALINHHKTILDQQLTLNLQEDGLIGLIELFQDTYLILISSHSVVASFQDKQLNRIERVLAIPLVYHKAYEVVKNEIIRTRSIIPKTISSSSSLNSSGSNTGNERPIPPEAGEDPPQSNLLSSPAEENFQSNKINLSRLLWKSKQQPCRSPPTTAAADIPGHPSPLGTSPRPATTTINKTTEETPSANLDARLSLDKKFIAVLCDELTRGGMFYALDWDITHSFQSKTDYRSTDKPGSRISEPLHKRARQRFWWNERMIQPFIRSGFDHLGYVIMQGFVESTQVGILRPKDDERRGTIPPGLSERLAEEEAHDDDERNATQPVEDLVEIEISLISRRSVRRPGLRYQRRGIDAAGSVANEVETECVMTTARADRSQTGDQHNEEEAPVFWSFLQVRGSVPLFWSQNPAGLRPPIILEGDPAEILDAMTKHFANLVESYGRILVICLAERSGNEGRLVAEFERQLDLLQQNLLPDRAPQERPGVEEAEKWVRFLSWDFHEKCKGMHYEKVVDLINQIDHDISQFGFFSRTGERQKGVIRSNCIDCLDRTNVIQSAIAKQVLNRFLRHLNLPVNLDLTHDQLDVAFNSLWANNGDQISKQYAGTSALKGDFVRTGKRNWRGMVNDATNSVARMWNNSISDFFKQRVLDYTLGINVTTFSQFQQTYSSVDPNDLARFAKFRAIAIEDAAQQVLSEGESKLDGWNFLTPSEEIAAHSVKAVPLAMEERIIILSAKALYVVSYEYVLSKVQDFLRIGLEDIISLQLGVYITSLADEQEREEEENYGLVIAYDAVSATAKQTTYSMRQEGRRSGTMTKLDGEADDSELLQVDPESQAGRTIKKVVFKAPRNLTGDSFPAQDEMGRLTAIGFVGHVIKRLERECNRNQIIFLDQSSSDSDSIAAAAAATSTDTMLTLQHYHHDLKKPQKLVLLLRAPIIGLHHLIHSDPVPLPFNLFARMSRGVKHIIG